MIKKLSFYLGMIALFFQASVTGNPIPNKPLPNREMIILLETLNTEEFSKTLNSPNIYKYPKTLHPQGIGAITVTLLTALYQKAAPIIANKSLIKNIVDHQNFFSDFVNLDRNSLYNKYSSYNKFQGKVALDHFRAICKYTYKSVNEVNNALSQLIKNGKENNFNQIISNITNNKKFNKESLPTHLNRLIGNQSHLNALFLEMIIYTMCNWIDFKNNWEIKQVNEDIFLLIPNDYIKNLNLTSFLTPKSTVEPDKFTALELELGLKVDHMKNVERSFFENPIQVNNQNISFVKSLAQIFVSKGQKLNQNSTETNSNTKHIWSLYFSGHGLPKCVQASVLQQLYDLKQLVQKKLSSNRFKKCKASETDPKHIYNCKHHKAYQKQKDKIKKLDIEIHKAEQFVSSTNIFDRGIIASLSIEEFREFLKFLNDVIETAFLYYTSCYAGGQHLIEPYIENGKPLILNYPVMSGTPAENESLQEFPSINIPPYSDLQITKPDNPWSKLTIEDIDIPKKKLKLQITLRFNDFFAALRKNAHNKPEYMPLISYSLHPHIDAFGKIRNQYIPNIPLIRFAKADNFKPVPHDNSFLVINEKNGASTIDIHKEAVLLYNDHTSGKVILNKVGQRNLIPKLFSMTPGFALHSFEEINSSTLNLREVVNSFLTFQELGSSKVFWIKKLECLPITPKDSKTKVFHDVIVMRNVFNSDTLDRSLTNDHVKLENCAYLSTPNHQNAKLTWDGPMIATDNYKLHIWNQDTHKEECLNCFPKAKSIFNPVLQSI